MDDIKELIDDIKNPKVSGISKFRDLDAMVKDYFSDGIITDKELMTLDRIDALLTNEFRVAQEHIAKMDKKSPSYGAAQELLNYMYRCRNLIDAAHNKAKVYNELDDGQKKQLATHQEEKTQLDLSGIGKKGVLLMLSLMTPAQRMAAERSFSTKNLHEISPAERIEIEMRIMQAIHAIRSKNTDAHYLNHILQLGHER